MRACFSPNRTANNNKQQPTTATNNRDQQTTTNNNKQEQINNNSWARQHNTWSLSFFLSCIYVCIYTTVTQTWAQDFSMNLPIRYPQKSSCLFFTMVRSRELIHGLISPWNNIAWPNTPPHRRMQNSSKQGRKAKLQKWAAFRASKHRLCAKRFGGTMFPEASPPHRDRAISRWW